MIARVACTAPRALQTLWRRSDAIESPETISYFPTGWLSHNVYRRPIDSLQMRSILFRCAHKTQINGQKLAAFIFAKQFSECAKFAAAATIISSTIRVHRSRREGE